MGSKDKKAWSWKKLAGKVVAALVGVIVGRVVLGALLGTLWWVPVALAALGGAGYGVWRLRQWLKTQPIS